MVKMAQMLVLILSTRVVLPSFGQCHEMYDDGVSHRGGL